MERRQRIPNDWEPRPYQRALWDYLERGGRRAVAVWHRRSGKDSLALNWTATQAIQTTGTYWHMLPTAKQARKVVWEGIDRAGRRILEQVFPSEVRLRKREDEMLIELASGSIWQLCGSDNFDSLVGSNPLGVVFSEYSIGDPRAWEYVRPILAENGGWALFLYTPRGRNHGAALYDMARGNQGWFAQLLTAKDTGAIPAESIEDERRAGMPEDMIQQEFFCSFSAAIPGSYYGRILDEAERQGRICGVPAESGHRVDTAWDLGIDDATAIWFFQEVGRELHVVDYFEGRGMKLEDYARELDKRGYLYGTHYLPHDVQRRELGAGKDLRTQLLELRVKPIVVVRRAANQNEIQHGIQQGRKILERAWFDRERCARGLEALRQYRSEYDEKGRVYSLRPVHDWTSHAADAWRTYAMGYRQERGTAPAFAGFVANAEWAP